MNSEEGDAMKQTFKSRLRRVAASALAAAALFSQPILTESAVYAAEPKAAGSPREGS